MKLAHWAPLAALVLALAACGGSETPPAANQSAEANAAGTSTNEAAAAANRVGASAPAGLTGCPFHQTQDWTGSVEGGRVLVTGRVDLQMAGFRPALTERPGSGGGTLALNLALVPEPNAPVTPEARYERRGGPSYARGEIWCGNQRIAAFNMIHVD